MAKEVDNVRPWIEHEAPRYDPAWAWKEAMGKYTAPPASERLEQHKTKFREFIESFLPKYKQKDRDAKPVRFDGATTWADVQEEATAAFDEYTRQGRSWRHPFRSSGRLFGTVACRIEFLIVLLPDGDYLGLLCGILALIYNAARRKRDMRELIIRTLDAVSEHIEGSKSYIRMYAWNDDVRPTTEDLYIAVLEAVQEITKWLEESSRGDALKAFFKQSDYAAKLEEKLTTNLQDKASAFGNCVTQCLHMMVQAVHRNVLTVGKKVEQVDRNVTNGLTSVGRKMEQVGGQVSRGLSSVEEHVEKLRLDALNSLEEYFYGLSKDVEWQFDKLEKRQREWFMNTMQNQVQSMNYLNATTIYMPQVANPTATVTVAQLIALLDLDPSDPSIGSVANPVERALERIRAERDFVVFFGRTLSPHRQSGISFIVQNPQFQDWFKSMTSRTLVIHGMDMSFDASEMGSPLSYMCAMLAQIVFQFNYSYPLAYFCRLHCSPEDKLGGAGGVMRSLIAQLLFVLANAQQTPDLDFLGHPELEAIRVKDLPSLCRVFEELLKRIGVGIVLCMVDGVSWFEKEPDVEGMHIVMQFLNSLVEAVEASRTGLLFKLMVTSPTTSQYCTDWFPNRIELYTPGTALMDGQGVDDLSMLMASQDILSGGMAFQYVNR